MKFKHLFSASVFGLALMSTPAFADEIKDFPNVLNLKAAQTEEIYDSYQTNKYNHFSDLGAWHGY